MKKKNQLINELIQSYLSRVLILKMFLRERHRLCKDQKDRQTFSVVAQANRSQLTTPTWTFNFGAE